ncbi:MAG: DUF4162 domain-containing protein, partial [Rhodoferax sp.]|nr:DUF4162 domain-containing protein [Actinomycetota bacterium]
EAERLAHDIVVIDHGRVIAHGTADVLKAQIGGGRLELVVADAARLGQARETLAAGGSGEVTVDSHTRRLTIPVLGGATALVEALRRLDADGIEVQDVGLRRPTLDDVFLTLTGEAADAQPPDARPKAGRGATADKDTADKDTADKDTAAKETAR